MNHMYYTNYVTAETRTCRKCGKEFVCKNHKPEYTIVQSDGTVVCGVDLCKNCVAHLLKWVGNSGHEIDTTLWDGRSV